MTSGVNLKGRPVWAEISLEAILHNLRVIRKHIQRPSAAGKKARQPMVLAVVKSNAYGLGSVPISKALQKAGTEWFGVTCGNEGEELRAAGIRRRILILTGFWPGEEKRLIAKNLTPAVTRISDLHHLERAAKSFRGLRSPFRFHLKINTGMNRLGIDATEIEEFAREFGKCRHIQLEGTFTHFGSAEDFASPRTIEQQKVFLGALDQMRSLGVSPGIIHMANSGAICARPESWVDMVRPGAILYGYHQQFSPIEKKQEIMGLMPLRPSVSMRARIISLRDVPAGQGVGYGARFVTPRPSRIGVINAGYADGIVRYRTNRGCVLVGGKRVPLVGTISMDLTAIDLTDVPEAKIGDIVTIYGRDGGAAMEVSDVAAELGTVTSDLLCALGRRVPRFYR